MERWSNPLKSSEEPSALRSLDFSPSVIRGQRFVTSMSSHFRLVGDMVPSVIAIIPFFRRDMAGPVMEVNGNA